MATLHTAPWAGKPDTPEDAFLATLSEAARRDGRKLCRRLLDEIERLPPARLPPRPMRKPLVAQLDSLLSAAPADVRSLSGAVAAMRGRLRWQFAPDEPGFGTFRRRHCFCSLTGRDGIIPSERLYVGLFMIDGSVFYPHHSHSADEIYLPISGDAVYAVGANAPRTVPPGEFIQIPSWTTHAVWTGNRPILMVWAWFGDIKGGYRIGGGNHVPKL